MSEDVATRHNSCACFTVTVKSFVSVASPQVMVARSVTEASVSGSFTTSIFPPLTVKSSVLLLAQLTFTPSALTAGRAVVPSYLNVVSLSDKEFLTSATFSALLMLA